MDAMEGLKRSEKKNIKKESIHLMIDGPRSNCVFGKWPIHQHVLTRNKGYFANNNPSLLRYGNYHTTTTFHATMMMDRGRKLEERELSGI